LGYALRLNSVRRLSSKAKRKIVRRWVKSAQPNLQELDFREDFGNTTADAIYAQRIAPNGKSLLPHNGIPICTAYGNQITPQASSDGQGGAFIIWSDGRTDEPDINIHRAPYALNVSNDRIVGSIRFSSSQLNQPEDVKIIVERMKLIRALG